MEKTSTDFIPLLEDIETPVVSAESVYPIKNKKNQNKECKCKCKKRIKKFLKIALQVFFVTFLLFAAIGSVAGYRWYRWVSREVQQFTVTEPVSFPINAVPTRELEILKDNAKLFWDSIQASVVPDHKDLVLSARVANGVIAASDFLRTNALAEIKNNELKMSVSIPTDGVPGGKGRFFNAHQYIQWHPETNRLTVKMDAIYEDELELEGAPIGQYINAEFELTTMEDDKTLNLQVLKGKAFGHKIPQEFIDEHYNLLQDVYNCDCHDDDCKQARKVLGALAGVSMEDGQVVVHAGPEPKEATYYKEHEVVNSWHHGHHGKHHHGKHDHHNNGQEHKGEHHGHHHHHHHHENGGHRALRETRAKSGHGHGHHWRALHMVRRLVA